MAFDEFTYALPVFGIVVGLAALLSAEAFHGLEYLLWVGGVVALLSVGALTWMISRHDPPADAGGH